MRITFKQALSASAILAYLAWDNFGKPIWTVNVERWAEQRNLDQTLNENVQQISVSVMPGWVIEWINFLTGDFMLGAAALGLLLLAVDALKWVRSLWQKLSHVEIEPSKLAENCRTMAAIIRANEPFLKSKFVRYQFLSIDLFNLLLKLEKLIGEEKIAYFAYRGLSAWPPILDAVALEMESNPDLRPERIKEIMYEFLLPQLPQDTEEGMPP